MLDLSTLRAPLSGPILSTNEADAQVTEMTRAAADAASPPLPPQLLLMRTKGLSAIDPGDGLAFPGAQSGVTNAPFSSIQVRMVPENVTIIPESSAREPNDQAMVSVRHGETLADALSEAGVPPDQFAGLSDAFGLPPGRSPVSEGERLRLQFLAADGAARRLGRVSIYADEKLVAAAALDDSGHWRPVDKAPALTASAPSDQDDDDDHAMRLYDSLFETALKAAVPRPDIEELVRIFGNDVDLQAAVAGGDSFAVLYEAPSSPNGAGKIVYASMTARGQTFRYYRFRAPDDKTVDYFDEAGSVRRKFLVREPIVGARLTSPFGAQTAPDPRLYPNAHRRRLGRPDRNAGLCCGRWRCHQGRPRIRLRKSRRTPACKWLCHDL